LYWIFTSLVARDTVRLICFCAVVTEVVTGGEVARGVMTGNGVGVASGWEHPHTTTPRIIRNDTQRFRLIDRDVGEREINVGNFSSLYPK
jgi:hypothetical protein